MANERVTIEVLKETGTTEFFSVIVNGRHIWRFDTISQAQGVAGNLRLALSIK